MMGYWKHDLSASHFSSRISQQEKISFRKIIIMDQYPKNSTRILITQDPPLPKLQILVINLKCTQSTIKTHTIISILYKITLMTLILLVRMKSTTYNTTRRNYILNMGMRTQSPKKNYNNWKKSYISLPKIHITNNKFMPYDCQLQWTRQLHWQP